MEKEVRPRIRYNSKVDVGYIELIPIPDITKISRTVEVTDYIRVDYDGDTPVGIEILLVHRTMPGLLPDLAILSHRE